MGSKKKNTAATTGGNLTTLKIGSRIRCTDDGVEGRITWANGVAVKIEWTDGEKVTWKRDSLATRPIEILDADDDQTTVPTATDSAEGITAATEAEQPAAPADTDAAEQATTTEQPKADPVTMSTTAEQPQAEPETTPTEPTATEPPTAIPELPATEPAAVPESTVEQATPSTDTEVAPTAAKPKRQLKAPTEAKEKKLSALDAAAKVLAEAGQAMNAQELIKAMADQEYWTSPGGKTPAATIYAAIISEIKKRGDEARFVKTERGKFARKA